MAINVLRNNEDTFPTEHLPVILRDAAIEIQRDVQAPIELVVSTLLAAGSLACQGLFKIKYPDGRVKPCSLYITVIADSGERKSAVYDLINKPILEFERKCREKQNARLLDYNAEFQAWKTQEHAILKTIAKKTGNKLDINEEILRLKSHYRNKPFTPILPKLIYNDTTPEALKQGLYLNMPSASLMSDEAGIFFRGRAKNNLGLYNQLWDGASFDVERKSGSFTIDKSNFTILLMIQSPEFERYLKGQVEYAVGSGFLARFLITGVTSMQGRRENRPVSNAGGASLAIFHKNIEKMLFTFEKRCSNGEQDDKYIFLSENAQTTLAQYQKQVEENIMRYRNMCPIIEGLLSKLPENLVRVAAIFSYLENTDAEVISSHNLLHASKIVNFYYSYVIRSRGMFLESTEQDADLLYNWLVSQKGDYNNYVTDISKAHVRRTGPYKLRNSAKLRRALTYLEEEGKVSLSKYRNPNGSFSEVIKINR